MADQAANPRGTGNRGTDNLPSNAVGNPGTLLGMETVGGTPMARFRAGPGTWVSASMKSLGYDRIFGRDEAYGAYRGVAKSPSGKPLNQPDRLAPGQEYLIPVPGVTARPDPKTDPARSGRSGPGVERPKAGAALPVGAALAAVAANAAVPLEPPVEFPVTPAKPPTWVPSIVPNPPTPVPPVAPVGPWTSLWELGPLGLALFALIFSGWALSRQRNEFEERVRKRALTWRSPPEPPPPAAPASGSETALAPSTPNPLIAERVQRAWQNGLISYDEYLLALQTGVLVIQPDSPPGISALRKQQAAPVAPKASGYATGAGEVLGYAPPTPSPVSNTSIGRERETHLPGVLQARFPNTEFRFVYTKGTPDVEWVGGEDPGFDIADLKPMAGADPGSWYKFVEQVRRWGAEGWKRRKAPRVFRAAMISYAPDGMFFVEDLGVVGGIPREIRQTKVLRPTPKTGPR